MAGTSLVKVVGLPQILKKVDAVATLTESRELVANVGTLAKTTLLAPMPSSWVRPRQVDLQITTNSARLSMPRYPYIFFERGSQRHTGGSATRAHRTKTAKQFKANGNYFIKPRRFIARTRAVIRKELKNQAEVLRAKYMQAWSS